MPAASPHAMRLTNGKGSACSLHPCRLQVAREGDPSAGMAVVVRPPLLGATLRRLRAAARPRPRISVLLRGPAAVQVPPMLPVAPKRRRPLDRPPPRRGPSPALTDGRRPFGPSVVAACGRCAAAPSAPPCLIPQPLL